MKDTRTVAESVAWVLVAGMLMLAVGIFANLGWRRATTANVEVAMSSMGP